jgi:F-type H+-transporting ATPase subunit delta
LKALAQRYARALVDVAVEQKSSEEIREELTAFVGLTRESADLRNMLASPAVPREKKHAVIDALAKRIHSSKAFRNFLCVLVDNRRTAMLGQIREAFEAQLLERLGVTQAQVTTARELGTSEKSDLSKALERLTGKRIEAEYKLDAQLIGGAVVRIGSTVYDGSVREQLNRLRANLAKE